MGETITAIEAWAEVGCAYLDCPLINDCRRNKSVRVAQVKPGDEGKLEQLVKTWSLQTEEPCYLDGNAQNGQRVVIQHFSVYEKRLLYQSF